MVLYGQDLIVTRDNDSLNYRILSQEGDLIHAEGRFRGRYVKPIFTRDQISDIRIGYFRNSNQPALREDHADYRIAFDLGFARSDRDAIFAFRNHYSGSLSGTWFLSRNFGLGADLSLLAMVRAAGRATQPHDKGEAFSLFIGPSALYRGYLPRRRTVFHAGVSAGYYRFDETSHYKVTRFYPEEGEAVNLYDTWSGSGYGVKLSVGADYWLRRTTGVGVTLTVGKMHSPNAEYGFQKEVKYPIQYETKARTFDYIQVGVGVRFGN